jgi:glycosyltransferase involved in cell wall biosynthesis
VGDIWLFSRDERTHSLFRSSWHMAAEEVGLKTSVLCRGFGVRNATRALRSFASARDRPRIIFGTSEICLYAAQSQKQDIWVFTGLGRLLIKENMIAQSVSAFLRYLYRGQRMVVLNEQDRIAVTNFIGSEPVVLEGEGYPFTTQAYETKQSSEQLTFAYVGRLLRSKGVDKIVRSFALHSKADWTLMLIGDTDFSSRDAVSSDFLRREIENSRGKIIATGYRSDVRSLLRSVDVLISMSSREGLPFSILDGVFAGVHIVLSPVPGHLSFEGLPGVTFAEPANLAQTFHGIFENTTSYTHFDRAVRGKICGERFGQQAIVKSIKRMLTEASMS